MDVQRKADEFGLHNNDIIEQLAAKMLYGMGDPAELRKRAVKIANSLPQQIRGGVDVVTLLQVAMGDIEIAPEDMNLNRAKAKLALQHRLIKVETREARVPVMGEDGKPIVGEDGKPRMATEERPFRTYRDDVTVAQIDGVATEFGTTRNDILQARAEAVASSVTKAARKSDPQAPQVKAETVGSALIEVVSRISSGPQSLESQRATLSTMLDALMSQDLNPDMACAHMAVGAKMIKRVTREVQVPVAQEDGTTQMERREREVEIYDFEISLGEIDAIARAYGTNRNDILRLMAVDIASDMTHEASQADKEAPAIKADLVAGILIDVADEAGDLRTKLARIVVVAKPRILQAAVQEAEAREAKPEVPAPEEAAGPEQPEAIPDEAAAPQVAPQPAPTPTLDTLRSDVGAAVRANDCARALPLMGRFRSQAIEQADINWINGQFGSMVIGMRDNLFSLLDLSGIAITVQEEDVLIQEGTVHIGGVALQLRIDNIMPAPFRISRDGREVIINLNMINRNIQREAMQDTEDGIVITDLRGVGMFKSASNILTNILRDVMVEAFALQYGFDPADIDIAEAPETTEDVAPAPTPTPAPVVPTTEAPEAATLSPRERARENMINRIAKELIDEVLKLTDRSTGELYTHETLLGFVERDIRNKTGKGLVFGRRIEAKGISPKDRLMLLEAMRRILSDHEEAAAPDTEGPGTGPDVDAFEGIIPAPPAAPTEEARTPVVAAAPRPSEISADFEEMLGLANRLREAAKAGVYATSVHSLLVKLDRILKDEERGIRNWSIEEHALMLHVLSEFISRLPYLGSMVIEGTLLVVMDEVHRQILEDPQRNRELGEIGAIDLTYSFRYALMNRSQRLLAGLESDNEDIRKQARSYLRDIFIFSQGESIEITPHILTIYIGSRDRRLEFTDEELDIAIENTGFNPDTGVLVLKGRSNLIKKIIAFDSGLVGGFAMQLGPAGLGLSLAFLMRQAHGMRENEMKMQRHEGLHGEFALVTGRIRSAVFETRLLDELYAFFASGEEWSDIKDCLAQYPEGYYGITDKEEVERLQHLSIQAVDIVRAMSETGISDLTIQIVLTEIGKRGEGIEELVRRFGEVPSGFFNGILNFLHNKDKKADIEAYKEKMQNNVQELIDARDARQKLIGQIEHRALTPAEVARTPVATKALTVSPREQARRNKINRLANELIAQALLEGYSYKQLLIFVQSDIEKIQNKIEELVFEHTMRAKNIHKPEDQLMVLEAMETRLAEELRLKREAPAEEAVPAAEDSKPAALNVFLLQDEAHRSLVEIGDVLAKLAGYENFAEYNKDKFSLRKILLLRRLGNHLIRLLRVTTKLHKRLNTMEFESMEDMEDAITLYLEVDIDVDGFKSTETYRSIQASIHRLYSVAAELSKHRKHESPKAKPQPPKAKRRLDGDMTGEKPLTSPISIGIMLKVLAMTGAVPSAVGTMGLVIVIAYVSYKLYTMFTSRSARKEGEIAIPEAEAGKRRGFRGSVDDVAFVHAVEYIIASENNDRFIGTVDIRTCRALALYNADLKDGVIMHFTPGCDVSGSMEEVVEDLEGRGWDVDRNNIEATMIGGHRFTGEGEEWMNYELAEELDNEVSERGWKVSRFSEAPTAKPLKEFGLEGKSIVMDTETGEVFDLEVMPDRRIFADVDVEGNKLRKARRTTKELSQVGVEAERPAVERLKEQVLPAMQPAGRTTIQLLSAWVGTMGILVTVGGILGIAELGLVAIAGGAIMAIASMATLALTALREAREKRDTAPKTPAGKDATRIEGLKDITPMPVDQLLGPAPLQMAMLRPRYEDAAVEVGVELAVNTLFNKIEDRLPAEKVQEVDNRLIEFAQRVNNADKIAEDQTITLRYADGTTDVIDGREEKGKPLTEVVRARLMERGGFNREKFDRQLRERFGGALHHEMKAVVLADGRVLISSRAEIAFNEDGTIEYMSATVEFDQSDLGTEVLLSVHSHPDRAKEGEEGKFLADAVSTMAMGLISDRNVSEHIIEADGNVRELFREGDEFKLATLDQLGERENIVSLGMADEILQTENVQVARRGLETLDDRIRVARRGLERLAEVQLQGALSISWDDLASPVVVPTAMAALRTAKDRHYEDTYRLAKKMEKTGVNDAALIIELPILLDAEGNLINEAVDRLIMIARNSTGEVHIGLLALDDKRMAVAQRATRDLQARLEESGSEAKISIETIDNRSADDFIDNQMTQLNNETVERVILLVSSANALRVAGNEALRTELAKGPKDAKAGLRIVGSDLIELDGKYGRACSIAMLAIPLDISTVVYMMGKDDEMRTLEKSLREKLKLEGVGIIAPIRPETLKRTFEAQLELERAM